MLTLKVCLGFLLWACLLRDSLEADLASRAMELLPLPSSAQGTAFHFPRELVRQWVPMGGTSSSER